MPLIRLALVLENRKSHSTLSVRVGVAFTTPTLTLFTTL